MRLENSVNNIRYYAVNNILQRQLRKFSIAFPQTSHRQLGWQWSLSIARHLSTFYIAMENLLDARQYIYNYTHAASRSKSKEYNAYLTTKLTKEDQHVYQNGFLVQLHKCILG